MCYKAPGPRCAYHTQKDIRKTEEELAAAQEAGASPAKIKELEEKLKKNLYLYSITRKARRELQQDIVDNGDPDGSKAKDLEAREKAYSDLRTLVVPRKEKVARTPRPRKASNGNDTLAQNRKTVIRELGVAAGLNGHDLATLSGLSTRDFATVMEGDLSIHDATSFHEAFSWGQWNQHEMPEDLKRLLTNGIILGNAIKANHYNGVKLSKSDIVWAGEKKVARGDAPQDLIIANDLWSLKANSNILKNGSPKDFYNTVFVSNEFQKTLHPLRDLNVAVYEEQFAKLAKEHNEKYPNTKIPTDWTEWKSKRDFTDMGWSSEHDATRCKKIAMERMKNTEIYVTAKTTINEAAAKAFKERLPSDLSKIKVGELMGYNSDFFYGSIDDKGKLLTGKVPNAAFMNEHIHVDKVWFTNVKQLNIFIDLRNKHNEIFTMQNEVRYSHGQFVSNPEVKRKQAAGSDIVKFMRG